MIEKEDKNLSKNVAIKRAKSNARTLAISSVSNIDEVKIPQITCKAIFRNCLKYILHV